MAFVNDIINRRGLNNKMHCQLQPKNTKGKAVLAVYKTAEDVLPALHTSTTKCINFKSRCVITGSEAFKRLVHSVV